MQNEQVHQYIKTDCVYTMRKCGSIGCCSAIADSIVLCVLVGDRLGVPSNEWFTAFG